MPLPPISAIGQVVSVGAGDVLFYTSTYIEPAAWYYYDAAGGKATRTALVETSPVNFDDAEVVRDFATSKDGTRVPLNIIRRKGTKLDGTNPTLLYGYGGYGISEKPYFSVRSRVFGWIRAASTSTRISAAAASTARNGTTRGTSRTSRTSLTISLPRRST